MNFKITTMSFLYKCMVKETKKPIVHVTKEDNGNNATSQEVTHNINRFIIDTRIPH